MKSVEVISIGARPSCAEVRRRMDDKCLVSIVAAILASGSWTKSGAEANWESNEGNREEGQKHDDVLRLAVLDAIDLVRKVPGCIQGFDEIEDEESTKEQD